MAASRRVGIPRDRAVYRIRRLQRGLGRPLVRSRRGGPGHGGTALTAFGLALARSEETPTGRTNRFGGTFVRGPPYRIRLRDGRELAVSFRATPGAAIEVTIPPEAILLAQGRFASSARNVWEARVAGRPRIEGGIPLLPLTVRGLRLRAGITPEAVRQLRLRPGRRVFVYVKATAVKLVGQGKELAS